MKEIKKALCLVLCVVTVLLTAVSAYALWDQHNIGSAKKSDTTYIAKSGSSDPELLPVGVLSAAEPDSRLTAAKEVNSEVVAWLTLDGTKVDYGVVRASNNNKYLDTAIDGSSYAAGGAIYLDYRNASDFSDTNNIVYGHNMTNGNMFGTLKKYGDSTFFNNNTTGTLQLFDQSYSLETVAFLTTLASDRTIIKHNVSDTQAWLNAVKEKAGDNYREGASANDAFLTLVTCKDGTTNDRNVLIVRLTDEVQPPVTPPDTPVTPPDDPQEETAETLIPVKKVITGDTPPSAETFTFVLKADEVLYPMPSGSSGGVYTVTRSGAGDIDFGNIDFTNKWGRYTYTVSEKAGNTPGWRYDSTVYKVTIVAYNDGSIKKVIAAEGAGGKVDCATFTNEYRTPTYVSPRGTASLVVSKAVTGDAGDKTKSFDFTVQLSNPAIKDTYGEMTFNNGVATFTLKDGESKTARTLPGGVTYTVTEADYSSDGYTTTKTGDTGTTADGVITTAAFTNAKGHYDPPANIGNLTVSKTVAGDTGDKTKSFNFTVTLSDSTINGTYGGMTFTNGVAAFTLKDGESKTAQNLPAGVTYTVTEADYTSDGYTTTKNGDKGTIANGKTSTAAFTNTKNSTGGGGGGSNSSTPAPKPKTADLTDVMPFIVLFGLLSGWFVISLCVRTKRKCSE